MRFWNGTWTKPVHSEFRIAPFQNQKKKRIAKKRSSCSHPPHSPAAHTDTRHDTTTSAAAAAAAQRRRRRPPLPQARSSSSRRGPCRAAWTCPWRTSSSSPNPNPSPTPPPRRGRPAARRRPPERRHTRRSPPRYAPRPPRPRVHLRPKTLTPPPLPAARVPAQAHRAATDSPYGIYSEHIMAAVAPPPAAAAARSLETGTKLHISNLDAGVTVEDVQVLAVFLLLLASPQVGNWLSLICAIWRTQAPCSL